MKTCPWLIPLGLPALVAQAPRPTVTVYAPPEQNVARLERAIKGTRGRLLIRPAGDPSFVGQLQALLKRAPLDEMELPTETLAPGSRLESDLAQRLGLVPGPCWVLVGGDLKVLALGRTVPDRPEVLAADLQAAGWKTRLEVLNDFLQRHPDHLEAQEQCLQLLLDQALQRLETLHGKGSMGVLNRPLTAVEDERIFGPFTRALAAFLSDPAFILAIRTSNYLPSSCHASALMAQTARRVLPLLESLLPGLAPHAAAWHLWMVLSTFCPERDPLAFVAALPRMESGFMFGSLAIYPFLRKAAERTGRWDRLVPIVEGLWVDMQSRVSLNGSDPKADWDEAPAILIEALVRLRRDGEAQNTLKRFLDWSGQGPAAIWAADLARACGRKDLAREWAALRPGRRISPPNPPISSPPPPGTVQSISIEAPDEDRPLHRRLGFRGGLTLLLIEPGTEPVPAPLELWRAAWDRCLSTLNQGGFEVFWDRIAPGSSAWRELQDREGWNDTLRWVLLDARGRSLESGLEAPTPVDLEALFRKHGQGPLQERAAALLRGHPGHPDALWTLLRYHLCRTSPDHAPETVATAWDGATRILRELATLPNPAEPYSRNIEIPDHAAPTPDFLGAARAFRERLEALLERCPSHGALWGDWAVMCVLTGGDPLALPSRVTPAPETDDVVDGQILQHVAKVLSRQGQWERLLAWGEPLWHAWEPGRLPPHVFPGFWPLLEAALRLQHEDKALAWVQRQRFLLRYGEPDHFFSEAAHAAEAAGRMDLAAVWGKRAEEAQRAAAKR